MLVSYKIPYVRQQAVAFCSRGAREAHCSHFQGLKPGINYIRRPDRQWRYFVESSPISPTSGFPISSISLFLLLPRVEKKERVTFSPLKTERNGLRQPHLSIQCCICLAHLGRYFVLHRGIWLVLQGVIWALYSGIWRRFEGDTGAAR